MPGLVVPVHLGAQSVSASASPKGDLIGQFKPVKLLAGAESAIHVILRFPLQRSSSSFYMSWVVFPDKLSK